MNLKGEKMERIMQEIWKEVLKLQKMPSIGDSFFDLGGNSFLAVQVIAILEEKYTRKDKSYNFFRNNNLNIISGSFAGRPKCS